MCAGSQAGNLKIWDLEAARLVRTHTGIYRLYLKIPPPPNLYLSVADKYIFYCSSN